MGDAGTTATEAPVLSTRLVQVVRTYCLGLEGRTLRDLRDSVASGRYPWLHEELRAALARDAFSPQEWERYVGVAGDGRESVLRLMRRQQQQVWSVVFPDDGFPGRTAPGG
ncbi:MAG TPA: hypothetical protein VJT31_32425 [Rugosimonospora sp.]|nr:hypothetical protein [Rugosimonospora sp.]